MYFFEALNLLTLSQKTLAKRGNHKRPEAEDLCFSYVGKLLKIKAIRDGIRTDYETVTPLVSLFPASFLKPLYSGFTRDRLLDEGLPFLGRAQRYFRVYRRVSFRALGQSPLLQNRVQRKWRAG
ncbi:hypothetical protein CTKA_02067 [Chthonomonas calidirosea]|uniref:Uncharacterized protein n=1 Tax=Chthonomonas calidirosea (strain DSM 23976 / ICMP 18418 / T49) TaxID=1303518 RepID=S0EWR6_CHTCT|nr:hypothetical protein CCALI_02028 [Chthonomonas calidirosea T49]CEK19104.1 hypothetical protein CTKA_02067 [Chthonomonas calidirosea]